MKPFSLEHWLDIYQISSSVCEFYVHYKGKDKKKFRERYVNLNVWIRQRIINKFDKND